MTETQKNETYKTIIDTLETKQLNDFLMSNTAPFSIHKIFLMEPFNTFRFRKFTYTLHSLLP